MFEWDVRDEFPEGHKPIIIMMKTDGKIPKVNDNPVYKWNFKKADWTKYAEAVERKLPKEYERKSVKKMERLLRKAIMKAGKRQSGKKKLNHTPNPGSLMK